MNNKYKLLKDLPDAKAGVIFEYQKDTIYYVFRNICYSIDTIQHTPDWFAPYLFTSEDGQDLYQGDTVWCVYDGDLETIEEHVCKTMTWVPFGKGFSTKEAAEQYLENLKPKFKVGDIVVSETNIYDRVFIGQLIDLTPVTLLNTDNTITCFTKKEITRKATNEEILEYYRQQGWVKGAKYREKESSVIRTITGTEYDSCTSIFWIISNSIPNKVEECELIKEPNYPKSWEEIKYEVIRTAILDRKKDETLTDIFATQKQGESCVAFSILTFLHKKMIQEYNRFNNCNWKPDWDDIVTECFTIRRLRNKLFIFTIGSDFSHLTFPTKELANFSLEYHNELWKQYYELE